MSTLYFWSIWCYFKWTTTFLSKSRTFQTLTPNFWTVVYFLLYSIPVSFSSFYNSNSRGNILHPNKNSVVHANPSRQLYALVYPLFHFNETVFPIINSIHGVSLQMRQQYWDTLWDPLNPSLSQVCSAIDYSPLKGSVCLLSSQILQCGPTMQ